MTRLFYRALLGLHPPAFRRQFGGELLWIFDQAAGSGASSGFCTDMALSLFRQWAKNATLWKVTGALAGASATLLWGWALVSRMAWSTPRPYNPPNGDALLVATLGALLALSFTLAITVGFFRYQIRRRN